MMMAKKISAEQAAIRAAHAKKEVLWHVYRGGVRGSTKDYKYGFFCDWKSMRVSLGDPPYKFHGEEVKESAWHIYIRWWPLNRLNLWIWKHRKAIIKLGSGF
jgi:hypothetical protein